MNFQKFLGFFFCLSLLPGLCGKRKRTFLDVFHEPNNAYFLRIKYEKNIIKNNGTFDPLYQFSQHFYDNFQDKTYDEKHQKAMAIMQHCPYKNIIAQYTDLPEDVVATIAHGQSINLLSYEELPFQNPRQPREERLEIAYKALRDGYPMAEILKKVHIYPVDLVHYSQTEEIPIDKDIRHFLFLKSVRKLIRGWEKSYTGIEATEKILQLVYEYNIKNIDDIIKLFNMYKIFCKDPAQKIIKKKFIDGEKKDIDDIPCPFNGCGGDTYVRKTVKYCLQKIKNEEYVYQKRHTFSSAKTFFIKNTKKETTYEHDRRLLELMEERFPDNLIRQISHYDSHTYHVHPSKIIFRTKQDLKKFQQLNEQKKRAIKEEEKKQEE